MATERDNAIIGLLVSATVNPFRFVSLSGANTVAQATAGATIAGVSRDLATYSSTTNTTVPTKLVGQGGTFKITASGAISAGAAIYVDTDGKATATANSGGAVATANEAATADGDIIEAIWIERGTTKTVAYTAIAADGSAGYYDLVTGLAAIPTFYMFLVYNGSTGAARVISSVVWTLGTARITVASLATGDKIMGLYRA